MSEHPLRLSGPRVELRLATQADVPAVLRYYQENAAFLKPWDPRRPAAFYTEAYWQSRIRQDHEDYRHRRSLHLFIFEHADPQRVIGLVNFNNIVQGVAWYCSLGYSLAENRQGHGFMREALELAIQEAFVGLGLHRIQANYLPHNQRSGGLLRRLGFVVEGYARDYLLIDGRWEDHVLTSKTNPDWRPPAG